jgi:hypothetical protein
MNIRTYRDEGVRSSDSARITGQSVRRHVHCRHGCDTARNRRAHCLSVTSRRGHSLWGWPASRGVTAAAPATPHAHDSVAAGRGSAAVAVLTVSGRKTARFPREHCRWRPVVSLRSWRDVILTIYPRLRCSPSAMTQARSGAVRSAAGRTYTVIKPAV